MNTVNNRMAHGHDDNVKEDIVTALVSKTTNLVLNKNEINDSTSVGAQVPKPNEILKVSVKDIEVTTQNIDGITFNANDAINFAKTAKQLELLATETVTDKVEEYLRQCKNEIPKQRNIDDNDFILPHELPDNDGNDATGNNNMALHDGDDFNEIEDDCSEGACALPTQLKESHTQCALDEIKPETIKYTTPQESDDSDDVSVHNKNYNNSDEDNDSDKETVDIPHPEPKPVPQLVYFNVRGIGEPLRLLFAYCKITYHDVRLTREEWHELRNTIPNCQIPMLVIGDKIIQHVVPIARYLGTLGDINGNTPLEAMEIDGVVETLNEFRHQILQSYYELDVRLKRRKVRSMNTQLVPATMRMMEKQVVDNNGYIALSKLTWADIFFVGLIEYLSYVSEHNLIDDYPALRQHADRVKKLRGIRQWIKIRPDTDV